MEQKIINLNKPSINKIIKPKQDTKPKLTKPKQTIKTKQTKQLYSQIQQQNQTKQQTK